MHVQERYVRGDRIGDRDEAEVDRADEQPNGERAEQEQRPERERDGCAYRPGHLDARVGHLLPAAFTLAVTTRMKSTTRGPQRDAMSSFTAITSPFFTALMLLQPGRLATFAAVCPQQTLSARTITS